MRRTQPGKRGLLLLSCVLLSAGVHAANAEIKTFLDKHCMDCHDPDTHKGGLDLSTLKADFASAETFKKWVKIHDFVRDGEMPPKKRKERPSADEASAMTKALSAKLLAAEKARFDADVRTGVRRLTRAEYENTIRDLFELDGIPLKDSLPGDGSAHGFDKNSDALDISHVNLTKYLEAADATLDMAIATQPNPPEFQKHHISLARYVAHILGNGDAVLLRDFKPDPEYVPAAEQPHIDQGAHERSGVFERFSSVGVFRHEDESFKPYFYKFAALYPGRYRFRAAFWSFQWDKGTVLPGRGIEAARLSVVQLQDDGRGGGHPSYVLGYFDAPSLSPQVHEFTHWLNNRDTIGFNTASLAPAANYSRKGRAMAFKGPGIASDFLDIEGPIHDVWPPKSHRLLFGELPIREFVAKDRPNIKPPVRRLLRQETQAPNRPDTIGKNPWAVESDAPLVDADRLFAAFLPRAFRRPVSDAVRKQYVDRVDERLKAGWNFEAAMRWAYRAALCSPDFLYHVEPKGPLDDYALANRLSYFLWNSLPDVELSELAAKGKLREPGVLSGQVERLLKDSKSGRFIEDFLGQWLKLRQIAANDPDRKLYPEFSPYLQDSMVAETNAFLRELIEKNLSVKYLVKSDFAMLNEKLATHYGIPGVKGSSIRRVTLPPDSPRGGFLTQAAILKITSNGTTTSPVPRGAFVMERFLGRHPEPPPPNIAAVEPDVRGATTIRELLDKHRSDASCASCHAKIDPPGFALESFDVIGGQRDRYRSMEGDAPQRGSIDPFIGLSFKLGPKVDASGVTAEGRKFSGILEFQQILADDTRTLLKNMAEQFATYGTGRPPAFSDRAEITRIVERTQEQGGGIRTLLHEVIHSPLFQTR